MAAKVPDRFTIAASAGLLIETLSDFMSVNLGLPLPRRLDQRYTIGEMWPAISKSLQNSSIGPRISVINGQVHLRNLAAHYNEWASNLSLDEALDFGTATLALWDSVFCPQCRSYLGRKDGQLRCSCGSLSVQA